MSSTKETRDNRKMARALGQTTFQGEPCRKGHTLRYTVSNGCAECMPSDRRLNYPLKPKITMEPLPEPVSMGPKYNRAVAEANAALRKYNHALAQFEDAKRQRAVARQLRAERRKNAPNAYDKRLAKKQAPTTE